MVYRYDLISGKVNHVAYQPPRGGVYYPDMLYHRYSYDAENRLTIAETSADSVVWEKDSRYEYYKHGPLARMVLGEQLVQGTDYAYTLQGWLKGVNSTALQGGGTFVNGAFQGGSNDMGADGAPGETNQYTARDAMGFALNYFSGEYLPVSGTVNPFPGHSAYLPTGQYKPLYNGNISSMAVNIGFPGATAVQAPQLYNYSYDQLNRITGMDVYRGLNQTTNSWAALAATTDYKERVSYDANGNILSYLRNGVSTTNTNMDNLTYNYIAGTNQLKYVQDNVADAVYADDIDNQSAAGNYTYDAIGNLTSDVKDSITLAKWNVYGKITEIQRTASVARPVTNIQYTYDASGNRISKRVAKTGTSTIEFTWYVRDASGNVMAVYNSTGTGTISSTGYTLNLTEQHLYGSSRLGVLNRNIAVKTTFVMPGIVIFTRGNKFFELSNHLQNVLVTVSDKKIQVDDGFYEVSSATGLYTKVNSTPDGKVDYYKPDIITANDYYPFGMMMPGRKYTANTTTAKYRFSINGQEKETELNPNITTAMYWEYDSRLGRRWNRDPVVKEWESPYLCFDGNPILIADPNGDTGTGVDEPIAPNGQKFNFGKDYKVLKSSFAYKNKDGVNYEHAEGAVESFQLGERIFTARYNSKTGAFQYYADQSGVAYSESWDGDHWGGGKNTTVPPQYQNNLFARFMWGAGNTAETAGNFVTHGAWQSQTWSSFGQSLEQNILATSSVPVASTPIADAQADHFINNVVYGSGGDRAEWAGGVFGNFLLTRGISEIPISSTSGGVTVFRAVDATEKAIVKSTRQFSLQPGGVEAKYFAKSLEDAHWYGQRLYPNGYTILQATVRGPVNVSQYWHPHVDIGAYVFPQEVLKNIIPH